MHTPWWRQAVLYHLYPLSFNDANDDGYGDLEGIRQKLDYLQWLGVSAIWLSPIYRSPMKDFGYDVSDYVDIDPIFGSLASFDNLLAEVHKRDMKLLLDFVPNHTSDQHAWFKESRTSRHSPKRDWYIWADSKPDGSAPNNWLSRFGGSAWKLDEATGQYYLHSFLPEQADLNWRNPAVKAAMLDVMRFWLNRGVDGFRTDAVLGLIKDARLRDNPLNPNWRAGVNDPADQFTTLYSAGQKELLGVIATFCDVLAEHSDRFLVSEAYLNVPGMHELYGACGEHPIHAPFNFNLMSLPWSATLFRDFINEYEASLGPDDLPNYVLGNHDRSRLVTRLGERRARMIALLQLTLRGMPVVYYGDELGLADAVVKPEEARDPFGILVPGYGFARDGERAPMAWTPEEYGGFSKHAPWTPTAPHIDRLNVATEQTKPGSLINLYQRLIQLRRTSPALRDGVYEVVENTPHHVYAYYRVHESQRLLVVLNFGEEVVTFEPPVTPKRLIAATHARQGRETLSTQLSPFEGRLYLISGEEID